MIRNCRQGHKCQISNQNDRMDGDEQDNHGQEKSLDNGLRKIKRKRCPWCRLVGIVMHGMECFKIFRNMHHSVGEVKIDFVKERNDQETRCEIGITEVIKIQIHLCQSILPEDSHDNAEKSKHKTRSQRMKNLESDLMRFDSLVVKWI